MATDSILNAKPSLIPDRPAVDICRGCGRRTEVMLAWCQRCLEEDSRVELKGSPLPSGVWGVPPDLVDVDCEGDF